MKLSELGRDWETAVAAAYDECIATEERNGPHDNLVEAWVKVSTVEEEIAATPGQSAEELLVKLRVALHYMVDDDSPALRALKSLEEDLQRAAAG